MQSEETKIAVLQTLVEQLTKEVSRLVVKVDQLHDKIDNHYVKKEDFVKVKDEVDKLNYWQAKVIGISLAAAFTLQYLPGVLKSILEGITK